MAMGPLLVLCHSYLHPTSEGGGDQSHCLFQLTWTINDNICKFIIDSNSCENVISGDLVSKLAISTTAHPKPYALMWLNHDNLVSVTMRALVNFSIGKTYRDSIWYDVVPMDACHLRCPWQYARRVVHDGYLNTYSFTVGGSRVVLYPSISSLLTPSWTTSYGRYKVHCNIGLLLLRIVVTSYCLVKLVLLPL